MRTIGLALGLLAAAPALAGTPEAILEGYRAAGAAAVSAPRVANHCSSAAGSL